MSSVRSSARPRRPSRSRAGRAGPRRSPSRRWPSRRCRALEPCRPPRSTPRSAAAAAISSSRLSRQRLARAARPPRSAFISTDSRTSSITASRSGSRLREERVEEARGAGVVARASPRGPRAARGGRRRRAPAPRARGRASRRAPGGRTGRRVRRRELPLGAAPAEADRQAAALPARRSAASTSARRPRAPKAITMSSGSASRSSLRGERPALAREPDRRQRPLADDHRMDELDGHVADVRARRGRAAERDQPAAAREALGHPVAEPRDPLGLAPRRRPRSPASERRAARRSPPRPRAVALTLGPAPAPRSRDEPVAERVDALARPGAHRASCSTPGWTASRLAEEAGRGRSRGAAAGRSC